MKLSLAFFVFTSFAHAEFKSGSQFKYTNIEGTLTIQCDTQKRTITCRDVFLDPWPYDVFVGPRNPKAEKVELQATVKSDTKIVIVPYNGKTGISSEINLGIYSLFQKPLLRAGENKIRYVLLGRKNEILETNTFDVSVARGKSRVCPPKEVFTLRNSDCDHPYTLCQLYFRDQNYCKANP